MSRAAIILLLITVLVATNDGFVRRAHFLTHGHRTHQRVHRSSRTSFSKLPANFQYPTDIVFPRLDKACDVLIDSRPKFSCPRKNEFDELTCIDAVDLCDDYADCKYGDDESDVFCLFKNLENEELYQIEMKIRLILAAKENAEETARKIESLVPKAVAHRQNHDSKIIGKPTMERTIEEARNINELKQSEASSPAHNSHSPVRTLEGDGPLDKFYRHHSKGHGFNGSRNNRLRTHRERGNVFYEGRDY